jgi:hypothetical protein
MLITNIEIGAINGEVVEVAMMGVPERQLLAAMGHTEGVVNVEHLLEDYPPKLSGSGIARALAPSVVRKCLSCKKTARLSLVASS